MTLLKELMTKAGLTQLALAEKLGVKQNTVSSWVTGRSKTPQHVIDMLELRTADGLPFIPCIPAPPPYGVYVPPSYEFSCIWQADPATGHWWNIRDGRHCTTYGEAWAAFSSDNLS